MTVLWISRSGSDSNTGTYGSPLATFNKAAQRAIAGDTVRVLPGTYQQYPVFTNKVGITFHGEGGVTIDGSLLLTGWRLETTGIWSAACPRPYCVWANGRQLLPVDQTIIAPWPPDPAQLVRGMCTHQNGRLHVRLWDSSDPGVGEVRIALGDCLQLHLCSQMIFDGIHAQFGLDGYKLSGSSGNVFQNAVLHDMGEVGVLGNALNGKKSSNNHYLGLRFRDIGTNQRDHGMYLNGDNENVNDCQFSRITGACLSFYEQSINGTVNDCVFTDGLPAYEPKHFVGDPPIDPIFGNAAMNIWGAGPHRIIGNRITGRKFTAAFNVNCPNTLFQDNTVDLQHTPFYFYANLLNNKVLGNRLKSLDTYFSGNDNSLPQIMDYNQYAPGGLGWQNGQTKYLTLAQLQATGREAHGTMGQTVVIS